MADIELVIRIPEEDYKNIVKQVDKRDYPDMRIGRAIADGTPLPKGHGNLKDADRLLEYGACPNDCNGTTTCMESYEHLHCPIRVFDIESINDTPTIIEADKEQE